jgi:hypothetical protein
LDNLADEKEDASIDASKSVVVNDEKKKNEQENKSTAVNTEKKKVEKVEKKIEKKENDDESEVDEQELLQEIFDELKSKKTKKISFNSLRAWEDLQELESANEISKKELQEMFCSVSTSGDYLKDELDFEQFQNFVELIDGDSLEDFDENNDDEEEDDEEEDDDDDDEEEDEDNDEEDDDEEVNKEIFDELSRDGKTVSVKDFLAWDEIQELKEKNFLDDETIRIFLNEVDAKLNGKVNFEQFSKLVNMIDQISESIGDNEEKQNNNINEKTSKKETTEDEDEEESDVDDEIFYKEIYDELKKNVFFFFCNCYYCKKFC